MTDIMVDLETLDTRPSAAIISIGACRVNWQEGVPSDPFYCVIGVASCTDAGLTESVATKRWWSAQSEEARKVFTDPNVTLLEGLTSFANYLKPLKDVKIWGNGSDFDNVILANAYDRLGLDAPWPFWNNRCFRTVKSAMKHYILEPPREGVYHNALDDAMHQARILLQLREHIAR